MFLQSMACLSFFFIYKDLFIYVKGRVTKRSFYWFTLHMAATAQAGLVQSREPGTFFWSPKWVHRSKNLGHSLLPFCACQHVAVLELEQPRLGPVVEWDTNAACSDCPSHTTAQVLAFHSNGVFHTEFLSFHRNQHTKFFFHGLLFWYYIWKVIAKTTTT